MRILNFIRLAKCVALLVSLSGCVSITPDEGDIGLSTNEQYFTHTAFDKVLKGHVSDDGLFDYAGLTENSGDIDRYYRQISLYSPDSHPHLFANEKEQLAYWINAYNGAVIQAVLNSYPIESVLDVKNPVPFFFLPETAGFFFFQRFTFGGATTSLYYLENSVIRKRFHEPRIHFALNCASLGCPRLPREPFIGERLDQQLDREARLFLAERRNFTIDHDRRVVLISSIFDWYGDDFTRWYQANYPGTNSDILDYISLYLAPAVSTELQEVRDISPPYSLEYIPYDWGLNSQ